MTTFLLEDLGDNLSSCLFQLAEGALIPGLTTHITLTSASSSHLLRLPSFPDSLVSPLVIRALPGNPG